MSVSNSCKMKSVQYKTLQYINREILITVSNTECHMKIVHILMQSLYCHCIIQHFHIRVTAGHVLGQTALGAISKDFKIEVPDDAILHCCLQIAQKTNQMVRIIQINRKVTSATSDCQCECNL